MKLKFKKQAYQTNAVEAVADCFAGQPKSGAVRFRIDPGRSVDASGQAAVALEQAGFKNADLAFAPALLLQNIRTVQRRQDLPESETLGSNKVCAINLDIEMETIDRKTLGRLDGLVSKNVFPSRSRLIQVAVVEMLARGET
jgi:type III restriction enzyme